MSSNVLAGNWNQNSDASKYRNDLECSVSFESFSSPKINGCAFKINKSGKLFSLKNGNPTDKFECPIPSEISKTLAETNLSDVKGALLVKRYDGGLSGSFKSKEQSEFDFEIPFMETNDSGTAKATLNNGVIVELKAQKLATLSLLGDFGKIRFGGACAAVQCVGVCLQEKIKLDKAADKKVCDEVAVALGEDGLSFNIQIINEDGTVKNQGWIDEAKRRWGDDYGTKCQNVMRASQSPSTTTSSSSKIDKAKATCTDLGFTAGTEKHGECVLRVMDN